MKNLLVTIFFFLVCSCGSSKVDSPVIAEIKDRHITLDEFRLFYSFDVNFGIDSTGIGALKDELLFYCDQIRAFDRAEKDGFMNDSIFIRSYNWEKERAMLRELYRQEVLKNVSMSDEELRILFEKQQAKVNLQHLFFKTESEASAAYQQINNNEISFKAKAAEIFKDDSLASSGGSLGWIKISDLDEQLSSALLNLPANVISLPVKSKWGYHLLLYKQIKKNPILTESEFVKNIPSLKKKIRAQKAQQLSSDFINAYIGDLNPQPDPDAFEKFWYTVVPRHYEETGQIEKKVILSPEKIADIKIKLQDNLSDNFISYKGGTISIKKFLHEISKIPLSHQLVFKTKRDLSNQIGKWIRDRLLLEKAYKNGIDENKRVLRETKRYMEEQSYYYYHSLISDTISVPEPVLEFFSNRSQALSSIPDDVAKYHTLQEWKFEKSKKILRKFFKKTDYQIIINYDLLKNENARINWDNKIRMFMVRKPS